MRLVAGELDRLDAAGDLALGIGDGLAMLAADHLGQAVGIGDHQFAQLEHHGLALRVRLLGPALAGLGGGRHRAVEGGAVAVVQARDFRAGGRVEDRAGAAAAAGVKFAVDVVGDVLAHDVSLFSVSLKSVCRVLPLRAWPLQTC